MASNELRDMSLEGASPLSAIHRKEAEARHLLATVRQEAEATVRRAYEEAASMRRSAEEEGRRAGDRRYQEALAAARIEAQALVATARRQTEAMHRQAVYLLDEALERALTLILPEPYGGSGDET